MSGVSRARPPVLPVALPAAAGAGLGALVVVAGARTLNPTSVPPTDWFGLQPPANGSPGALAGALLATGIAGLVVLWVLMLRRQVRASMGGLALASVAAAWQLPFLLGPPLISKDVWAYRAQGLLRAHGIDPYAVGAAALRRIPGRQAHEAMLSVDPTWRRTPSPYGPLTTAAERVLVGITGGNPVGVVVALRVLAVAAIALAAWAAGKLAGEHRRQVAVAAVALNPLVLVHGLSGAHIDLEVGAVVAAAAVFAARRDRWALAVALCCVAGSVKAPGFAAAGVLLVLGARRAHWSPRRLATGLAAAAATTAVCSLAVPDGMGWLRNLGTPGQGHRPTAPAALLAGLLRSAGMAPGMADGVARVIVLAAAAAVVVVLLATAGRRPTAVTVSWTLLVTALTGPAFYPWYLLWALPLLPVDGARRRAVVAAGSAVAVLLTLTGLPTAVTAVIDALAAVAAVAAVWVAGRRERSGHAVDPGPIAARADGEPDDRQQPAEAAADRDDPAGERSRRGGR